MADFELHIMTPEREFFNGRAQSLTVTAPDGELCILAGHLPLVAPLVVGEIKLRVDGDERTAFCSAGFIEVLHDRVMVFSQACEWPEEIDVRRARESLERAREKLRQKQSMTEYRASKIALARAMSRLRVTHSNVNIK